MQQKLKEFARLVGALFLSLFMLAACGDIASPGVSPATPVPTTTAPPVTSTANTSPSPAVTTNSAQPANLTVVVVGQLNYNPQANASSANPADWPELRYAADLTPRTPPEAARLKLDPAQWQLLNNFSSPPGVVARLLVQGQRLNVQGQEVLQVAFMEALEVKPEYHIGTFTMQGGDPVFTPEGIKSPSAWHLLVNSALIDPQKGLAGVIGKRVLLVTEKLQNQPGTYYVSRLDRLGKGSLFEVKTDSMGYYSGAWAGPTETIGTSMSGYLVRDKASGKDYYLILAEGIDLESVRSNSITLKGETLVSDKGGDMGGLFYVTSVITGS